MHTAQFRLSRNRFPKLLVFLIVIQFSAWPLPNQIQAPLRVAAALQTGRRHHDTGMAEGDEHSKQARAAERYGKLPGSFEMNQGQADSRIRFSSHGNGCSLLLAACEAVLIVETPHPGAEAMKEVVSPSLTRDVGELDHGALATQPVATETLQSTLRMKLVGGNPDALIEAQDLLCTRSNYLIGNDPQKWRTDVPHYGRVQYRNVYPGVDLTFYGNQGQLEYDFIVAPGAHPRAINLSFEGAEEMRIDSNGDLVISTGVGEVRHHKPIVYQDINGSRKEVSAQYVMEGNMVGFETAPHDESRSLIIDPVLSYSTFLGGGNDDSGYGITVDSEGNAYVVGITNSSDFPTTAGTYSRTLKDIGAFFGGGDVFVSKLNPDGTSLIYSTYIGGSNYDDGRAIAVDASGNVYITGSTLSSDFPVVNGLQPVFGGSLNLDAFVTKLNPSGSALIYSTYLGGRGPEIGYGIAVNPDGTALVVGETDSDDYPVVNPIKPSKLSFDSADAFLSKVSSGGDRLEYSTYFGGSSGDVANSIAVDSSGSVYMTGVTNSPDFPTANPFQAVKKSDGYRTAWVSKINSAGASIVYSTFLGGSFPEEGFGIAVDSRGSAYVAGYTYSSNFPTTPDAFQPVRSVEEFIHSPFVTKLSPEGSELEYSTYLGGFGEATGIALDGKRNAYVTGFAGPKYPTTKDAFKRKYKGSLNNELFISKLNSRGSALEYSTYYGSKGSDVGRAIALDSKGDVYLTGSTSSGGFPTTRRAFQGTFGGGTFVADAFVLKFEFP